MNILTTYQGVETFMDDSLLEKRTGKREDENQIDSWVEYWFMGTLVHRSMNIHLKRGLYAEPQTGSFR